MDKKSAGRLFENLLERNRKKLISEEEKIDKVNQYKSNHLESIKEPLKEVLSKLPNNVSASISEGVMPHNRANEYILRVSVGYETAEKLFANENYTLAFSIDPLGLNGIYHLKVEHCVDLDCSHKMFKSFKDITDLLNTTIGELASAIDNWDKRYASLKRMLSLDK